jgi:hypothetical protein
MSRFDENPPSARQILINNYPLEDFLGLTSSEMKTLLYGPFCNDSPFSVKESSIQILNKIRYFRKYELSASWMTALVKGISHSLIAPASLFFCAITQVQTFDTTMTRTGTPRPVAHA